MLSLTHHATFTDTYTTSHTIYRNKWRLLWKQHETAQLWLLPPDSHEMRGLILWQDATNTAVLHDATTTAVLHDATNTLVLTTCTVAHLLSCNWHIQVAILICDHYGNRKYHIAITAIETSSANSYIHGTR